MSRSIDERIVEMRFNNRQFESGVKESLGSLDRLKKGLDLDGASKSLTGLSDAGRKFSFAGLAEGVDTIAGRFTTLGIIGVAALQNITNKVIELGSQMVKSLVIEPIIGGLQQYETEVGAVQTIMAATGKTIDDVEGSLERLVWFTDETSYSFSDMVNNIGKFTSQGIDLDKSVTAMQGIANWAAVSGQNAESASRAMYNMAQAIGVGSVTLIDWKSIQNANMATEEFKNTVIETAKGMDLLDSNAKTAKGTLVSSANFASTLQEKWFTSDVLMKTLENYGSYADEVYRIATEKGITASEAMNLVGDGFTDVAVKSFKAAQEAKTFTDAWKATQDAVKSGWSRTWKLIFGNYEEAKILWTDLANFMYDVFAGPAEARNELLQGWKDLGGRDVLIESFWSALDAIGKAIAPIKDAFRDIFPPMTAEKLFGMTEALRDFIERIKIGDETADKIRRTFAGFFAVLDIGKQIIEAIARGIGRLIKALSPGTSILLDFSAGVGDWLVQLNEVIKKGNIFNKAVEKIADVIDWVAEKVGIGVRAIIGLFKGFADVDLSGVESFTERVRINFEPFSALFDFIGKTFSKTIETLKKVAPLFFKLAGIIGKAITDLQDKIISALDSGDFKAILDLINTGLIGALILGIKKFVDSMSDITGGVAGILDGVRDSLEAWQTQLKAGALLKIAFAIGVLAAALFVLAMIDSEKLTGALIAITALFVELFGAMAIFSGIMKGVGVKGLLKLSVTMIGVSIAVLILASALKKLADVDAEDLGKGLVAVGALLAMLTAVAKILSSNTSRMMKGALGLIFMATAVLILSSAVKKMGEMDLDDLAKGLGAVAVLLASIAGFTKIVKPEKLMSIGIAMIAMGMALVIMASAVKKLGEMDAANLAKGLLAIAVVLASIAGFTKIVKPEKLMATSFAMILMGTALAIISSAVGKLGEMDIGGLVKGLVSLAAILALIAGFTHIVKPAQMLATAAAMLVMSMALSIMAKVLTTLGNMSWGEILKGFVALIGIFAILGVAGLVLGPLVPVLLGVTGAVALLGLGMLALGAGLLLFSAGLSALAVSGTAGAAALVLIVTSLIGLIPFLLEQIGLGIIAFAKVIIEGMPYILEAIGVLFAGIITLLGELTPPLIETVLNFILELLTKLVEYVPQFVDAGMKIIIGFLKGIADNITKVVKTGIDIVLNFLDGIRQKIPDIIDMAFKLIIAFINGLADAIRNNHNAIFNAVENLINAIIDAVKSLLGRLPGIGMDIIRGLIQGIKSMATAIFNAAVNVVRGAINGVKRFLGIRSPSTVFAEIGQNGGKGLVVGIEGMSGKVADASKDLGKTAVDSMSDALAHVSDVLDSDVELTPTIRPVVDMTDVESGLSRTFDKKQGIDVTASTDKVSKVAARSKGPGDASGINQTNSTDTDNSRVAIQNYYTVRNDNDIRKISRDQQNLLDRYSLAKGVPVPT